MNAENAVAQEWGSEWNRVVDIVVVGSGVAGRVAGYPVEAFPEGEAGQERKGSTGDGKLAGCLRLATGALLMTPHLVEP